MTNTEFDRLLRGGGLLEKQAERSARPAFNRRGAGERGQIKPGSNLANKKAADSYKDTLEQGSALRETEKILYLRPEELINDPRQPRDDFARSDEELQQKRKGLSVEAQAALSIVEEADLKNFAADLKQHGMLHPIIARPPGSVYRSEMVDPAPERYQIIAGERRWRGSMLAGLMRVPVIVRDISPQEGLELQIVENDQRVDVSPRQRALGYMRLQGEFGYGVNEIAARVNRPKSHVSTHLSVFGNKYLAGMVDKGDLTLSEAITLLPLPDAWQPRMGNQIAQRRKQGRVLDPKRYQERVAAINEAIGYDRRRKDADLSVPRNHRLLDLDVPLPEKTAGGVAKSAAQIYEESLAESAGGEESQGVAVAAAPMALNDAQSGKAGIESQGQWEALFGDSGTPVDAPAELSNGSTAGVGMVDEGRLLKSGHDLSVRASLLADALTLQEELSDEARAQLRQNAEEVIAAMQSVLGLLD